MTPHRTLEVPAAQGPARRGMEPGHMMAASGGAETSPSGKQATLGPKNGPEVVVIRPQIFLPSSFPGPVREGLRVQAPQ